MSAAYFGMGLLLRQGVERLDDRLCFLFVLGGRGPIGVGGPLRATGNRQSARRLPRGIPRLRKPRPRSDGPVWLREPTGSPTSAAPIAGRSKSHREAEALY